MRNKTVLLLAPCFFISACSFALPPGTISKHIKIDQFGYLPASRKVAVIVDPQTGYNASESFNPGTGANQYQVRNWTNDVVVYSGTLVAWNGGATQEQSGDRGWWFDFSGVTTTGSYYIYDVVNNVGSPRFEINASVYADVIRQAARVFFYQRVNFAKQPPYTDGRWADGAAFNGPNQDFAARSRYDKTNPATARDVHGGWFDAGDYNKYVTFSLSPLCNLLETYRMHPSIFTDDYNIPESGNGIADILDEVKWEIDWLIRMQDATGTNGLLLKVGADNYNSGSPPSTDNNPRYWVPECTSSTLTGAAVFALAATVYRSLGVPSMTSYANDLQARAISAWQRALVTTSGFTSFQTSCDDQNIVAGDADADVESQRDLVVTAAAYLYEATGDPQYRTVFDAQYVNARPYAYWWWGPYFPAVQRALLRYTQLAGATPSVANNIRNVKAGQNGVLGIDDYSGNTDLYRSSMPDAQYHWNSHEVKANAGLDNFDFATFGINSAQQAIYKETGESYLHWFHGINPMGKVMLTNMYAFGGDSCVNEFYHSWFGDGTPWDNVFTSTYGPPPGYVPGGPNKDFSIPSMNPPGGQPPQKSYKEWNTGWNGTANENSWEITEAGIYTQAAYISLLARVMATGLSGTLPLQRIHLSAERQTGANRVSWEVADPSTVATFTLQRSGNGTDFEEITNIPASSVNSYSWMDHLPAAQRAVVFYRVKAIGHTGETVYSGILRLDLQRKEQIAIYPNPVKDRFTLAGTFQAKGMVQVNIRAIDGHTVYSEKWEQLPGNCIRDIALPHLGAGVYSVEVKQHTTRRVIPLIIASR